MAFNGRFIVNVAHFAAKLGGNSKNLIELSGLSEEALCNENCMVSNEIYNAIIEEAITATKDPFFGLHAGENLNLSAAGLIGQITQTSETVKQALELCCEFANLGCSVLPLKLREEKTSYSVSIVPDELWKNQSPNAVQHTTEGVLAFTIKEFHTLTRMKHYPVSIYVTWPHPENISEYTRVFGCPVYFNKDQVSIQLKKTHVEEKVVTANFDLLRILLTYAEEKSAQIKQELGFKALVKQSVINLVKPEFPTIEQVAQHLNISPRTLQRRLHEESETYKGLTDKLRKEFAISYLKQPQLSISEIAYLLSYAETSVFSRSFKRWTGSTPLKYRSQQIYSSKN